MATIGFVVHPKAEDDVFQFVKVNSRLISKIVITKTDKGKVETLFDKKDITQLVSVVEKGDAAMAAKVSKGEVQAVFFINPLPEHAAGIMELIHNCVKRKVYLAFTVDTADCILGRIGTSTFLVFRHLLFPPIPPTPGPLPLFTTLPLFLHCFFSTFPLIHPPLSSTIPSSSFLPNFCSISSRSRTDPPSNHSYFMRTLQLVLVNLP